MASASSHTRSVIIYAAVALIAAAAIGLYQNHTNDRLDKADRASCENRKILSRNQKVVLAILHRNVTKLRASADSPTERRYWYRSLMLVERAQADLDGTQPVCGG